MQINLTGFLESKTPAFMSALWSLLLDAQNSPAGVPSSFVQEKKEELRQKHEADERALAEARRRGEHDLRLDEVRHALKLPIHPTHSNRRFDNANAMNDAAGEVIAADVAAVVETRFGAGPVTQGGAIAVEDVQETYVMPRYSRSVTDNSCFLREAPRAAVLHLQAGAGRVPHPRVDGIGHPLHPMPGVDPLRLLAAGGLPRAGADALLPLVGVGVRQLHRVGARDALLLPGDVLHHRVVDPPPLVVAAEALLPETPAAPLPVVVTVVALLHAVPLLVLQCRDLGRDLGLLQESHPRGGGLQGARMARGAKILLPVVEMIPLVAEMPLPAAEMTLLVAEMILLVAERTAHRVVGLAAPHLALPLLHANAAVARARVVVKRVPAEVRTQVLVYSR